MRHAIQLYSLRSVERPLPELIEAVAQRGYDGVEFAYRVDEADASPLRSAMDAVGIVAAGAHVPIEQFESLEATLDRYTTLGCETLVVPYLPPERFADGEAIGDAAAELAALADDLAAADIACGYHNHDHEFVTVDGEAAYDVLAGATPTSLQLQVDVGLAALAGRDPVALIERYADRIAQVHLKDYDLASGESVDLGDGDVDIAACVAAARAADVAWAIVEFESSDDPLASAERSIETLSRLA